MRYKIIKIIKIKSNRKDIFKKIDAYPYSLRNLGHAKACARIVNSEINYNLKNNNIINVVVFDSSDNPVFVARTHIDGVWKKQVKS